MITRKRASMKSSNNRKVLPHLIWLSVLVIGLGYFLSYGTIVSDVSQFMPQSATQLPHNILLNQMQQGATARYLLVRLEAEDEQRSADLARQLKQHLQQNPLFASINNGEQEFDLDKDDLFFH